MRKYSLPRPVNVGAATCGAAAAVAGGGNAAGGGGSVSGNKSSSFDISLHTNAPVEAGSRLDAAAAYTPVAVAPERGGRTMLVLRGGTLIDGTGDRVSPSGHECLVPPDPALPRGVANGVDDVRRVVRLMIRAGADVIKCATTGGASSRAGHGPKDPAFDAEEMRALVEESHAQGRKVMCHARGGPRLRLALEAGVDSIEHGCYLDEDPELIPMMAERRTFFVPTLTVYTYHSESKAPHVRERSRALRAHHVASIHRALAAGVRVVAGTDAGGHGHPPNAAELEHLVAAGLTPMHAIQAATSIAAECVGLAREIGTVEKAKRADLVVVAGDPLADVRVLQEEERIRLVVKDGAIVVRRSR